MEFKRYYNPIDDEMNVHLEEDSFTASQKFSISGFKAFDKKGTTIDEKYLTVLTGKNSSGKSSFLEAIIFKNEILKIICNGNKYSKNKGIVIDLNKLSVYKKGLRNIINRSCSSIILTFYNTSIYPPVYEVEIEFIIDYSKERLVSKGIKMKRNNGDIIYSIDYMHVAIYYDQLNIQEKKKGIALQTRVFKDFNYGACAFSILYDINLPKTYKYIDSLKEENIKPLETLANYFFTTETYFELSTSELVPFVDYLGKHAGHLITDGYSYRNNVSLPSIFDLLYELASIVNKKQLSKLEAINYLKDKNNRSHLIQSKFEKYGKIEQIEMNLFNELINTLLDDLHESFELLISFYQAYDKLVLNELKVFRFESRYNVTVENIVDIYNLKEYEKNDLDSLYSQSKYFGEVTFETALKISTNRAFFERTQSFEDNSLLSKMINEFEIDKNKNERILKLNEWLSFLDIASSMQINKLEDRYSIFLINKLTNEEENIKDLGFGFSQLLPILIQLTDCLFSEGKTILIEEPESNLHPALQSKLANIFCDKQFKKNLIIIETHSEYLIRKLQYLTAKKEIKPEDTQIYYFYPPGDVPEGEKQVYPINIMEDGSLTKNFGKGFFDEADNIALELFLLKNQSN